MKKHTYTTQYKGVQLAVQGLQTLYASVRSQHLEASGRKAVVRCVPDNARVAGFTLGMSILLWLLADLDTPERSEDYLGQGAAKVPPNSTAVPLLFSSMR